MPSLETNELVLTVVDQAHTIRKLTDELAVRDMQLAQAVNRITELEQAAEAHKVAEQVRLQAESALPREESPAPPRARTRAGAIDQPEVDEQGRVGL